MPTQYTRKKIYTAINLKHVTQIKNKTNGQEVRGEGLPEKAPDFAIKPRNQGEMDNGKGYIRAKKGTQKQNGLICKPVFILTIDADRLLKIYYGIDNYAMKSLMDDIYKELKRLGIWQIRTSIEDVINYFDGYPFDMPEHMPVNSLKQLLSNINSDNQNPVHEFTSELPRQQCFSYRAYRWENEHAIYWNPLIQTYKEFESESKQKLSMYQSDIAFPSSDIIKRWFASKLHSSKLVLIPEHT